MGALPKALASGGNDVDVFLPFHLEAANWYRQRRTWPEEALPPFDVSILGLTYRVGILWDLLPGTVVPIYFIAHDPLFHRRQIYAPDERGHDDGLWRFSLFVRASIEVLKRLGRKPRILHIHDWHPALGAMLAAWSNFRDRWFDDVASVLTIHNLGYQGIYGPGQFPALGLPLDAWTGDGVRFNGNVNLLRGAIAAADMVTAVSPTYADEIRTQEGGSGLDAILRARGDRVVGILNGIDRGIWNPATDGHIAARYSPYDLAGKEACRADLCRLSGFDPADGGFLLGTIGRLTDQKGFDLLLESAPELVRRGVRIVMLGSGEPAYEGAMRLLEARHPGRFKAFVGYDEGLSHRIEAGADAFVMPSRFEPCGLSQMYALAYGTPPIVRRTGGLADSVVPYDGGNLDRATGFAFEEAAPHALAAEILHARHVFFQRDRWRRIVANGMAQDFSWDRSAERYEAVYRRACEVRGLPW